MKRSRGASLVAASPVKRGPAAAVPAIRCEDCGEESEAIRDINGCLDGVSVPSMKIDGISHDMCCQCALKRIQKKEPMIHCTPLFERMEIRLTETGVLSRHLDGLSLLALYSHNPALAWPTSLIRPPPSDKRKLYVIIESNSRLFERCYKSFPMNQEIRFSDILGHIRQALSFGQPSDPGWSLDRLGDPRRFVWNTRVMRSWPSPLEIRCFYGTGAASMYYFQIRSIVSYILRLISIGPIRLVFEFAEIEDIKYDSRIVYGKTSPVKQVVSRMMEDAKNRHDEWASRQLESTRYPIV